MNMNNTALKRIENTYLKGTNCRITFDKIKPFYNNCPVTKMREEVNIEIDYVPNDYLLEIESYRKFFSGTFDCYIEELAKVAYDEITFAIAPKELRVRVYLTEQLLTPWKVEIL